MLLRVLPDLNKRSKAAIWFTVCSFLQKGISFITVPIFTRMMTTEQYGTFTVYISWYQILNILTSLYLFNGVYDNALSKYDNDRDRMTSSFLGLTVVVTGIEFFLYIIFRNAVSSVTGLSSIFIILMFVEALFTPALAYWSGRQRFEYEYRRLVAVTLAKSVISPLLGIFVVYYSGGLALGRVASTVFVEFVFGGILLILQMLKGRCFFSRKYWDYGLRLAVPILPHYLSGMILNQGDRILIDRLLGKTEVALYGLASNIGMIVQIFVTSVNSAITPWLYEKMKKNQPESMRGTLTGLMAFIAVMALGLMLVCPEAVAIFGPPAYSESIRAVPPIAASVFFIFLYGILSFPEFYFEKTSFLAVSSLIAAAINVILNYLCIPRFGYEAAAYTTLICYILYSGGHYLVSMKIIRDNNSVSIVDGKSMLLISVFLIAATILIGRIMDKPLIRYTLIAMILAVAVVFRKQIIAKIKEIRKK